MPVDTSLPSLGSGTDLNPVIDFFARSFESSRYPGRSDLTLKILL
jgi:hypothetical protein